MKWVYVQNTGNDPVKTDRRINSCFSFNNNRSGFEYLGYAFQSLNLSYILNATKKTIKKFLKYKNHKLH